MFRTALALAALLAVLAGARAQSQCATNTIGSTVGDAIPLPEQYMTPDIREWAVAVRPDTCQEGSYHVGTAVTACDADIAPRVDLETKVSGLVHRNGDLQSTGVIDVTVYCVSPVGRRQGDVSKPGV